MSVAVRASQQVEVSARPSSADFKRRVKEAAVAIESAMLAAETLAGHGVVESLTFERMMDFLEEASAAVDLIDAGLPPAPTTIFLNRACAQSFIEQHALDGDHLYQIREDAIGQCTIAVFRLLRHL
jgi:hypothetical protein